MAPRVFMSYYADDQAQQEKATRLLHDLQNAGVEVMTDTNHGPKDVLQLLEDFQYVSLFVLLQSSEAIHDPHIQSTTFLALSQLQQSSLRGIRFIISASLPQDLPEEWIALPAIDATQSYDHAWEQLLHIIVQTIATASTSLPHPSSVQSEQDQVLLPPKPDPPPSPSLSGPRPETQSLPRPGLFTGQAPSRNVVLLAVSTVFVIAIFLFTLVFVQSHSAQTHTPSSPQMSIGNIYFTSSLQLDATNTKGLNDGVEMDLVLPTPAPGKQYFAWLLQDASPGAEETALLVGQPSAGHVHLIYQAPTNRDLLSTYSRFLLTEEQVATQPDLPSPDKQTWRYAASIPQQTTSMANMGQMSLLDHMRHLLSDEPHLVANGIRGGLALHLQQNIGKILEWASAARGIGQPQSPDLMHRHFIRILDYLDGPTVNSDVPPNTPVLAPTPFGLLTFSSNQSQLGYLQNVDLHMQALAAAPGATHEQQALATVIDQELNQIKAMLQQIQVDAHQLVLKSNAQLLANATLPLLDDLVSQANNAYTGRFNATTGIRQGGAVMIRDTIQHLAMFTVTPYTRRNAP